MSVKELEEAVARLDPEEQSQFFAWVDDYRERAWDEQIARDVRAGRFEEMLQRAKEQFAAGQCRKL